MCDYRTIDMIEIGVGNDAAYAERPMDSALACAENQSHRHMCIAGNHPRSMRKFPHAWIPPWQPAAVFA